MTDKKPKRLTKEKVEALLKRLQEQVPRPECRSCECLQGFIAQLALDAEEDARPMVAEYRETLRQIQAGLGCEPCPPAELFAEYLLHKREEQA